MKSLWLAASVVFLGAGCTTYYQAVSPVDPVDSVANMEAGRGTLFCVIDNPVAGNAWMEPLQNSLARRDFEVKMLPPGSHVASCPLTATYVGTRKSFLKPFLAHADITIYRNGERVGKAIYDAMRSDSGLNLSNLISPQDKLEELVDGLFPGLRPLPPAAEAPAANPGLDPAPVAPAPSAGNGLNPGTAPA